MVTQNSVCSRTRLGVLEEVLAEAQVPGGKDLPGRGTECGDTQALIRLHGVLQGERGRCAPATPAWHMGTPCLGLSLPTCPACIWDSPTRAAETGAGRAGR